MALSDEEIKKELREPRKKAEIGWACLHQERIRFHTETKTMPYLYRQGIEFLNFVENLLPHDKFKLFKALFRYPVLTTEVTGICFDKLSRIFEGRNPSYDATFIDSTDKDDWGWYRTDVLKEPKIWTTKGWEFFKTEINSVLIVDLPIVQESELPEPYFYWLPIASVISYKADRTTGIMDWIIFKQDDNKIAFIDDEKYMLFEDEGNRIVAENYHNLGVCPARFFWNEPLTLEHPDIKKSPITKVLSELDWYLFYAISKQHLDLFGSYPIYSGYQQACDYSNAENGDKCDGGYLKDRQGHYKLDLNGILIPCPKCGNKRIIGAGSFVEVPVPYGEQPDLRDPVHMLAVDRSSLDYNVSEVERLKNQIITTVVGTNEEITTRDALNEQQIRANFESQSTVLNRVQKGFEEAMEFVDTMCCRLRYGDNFVGVSISLGTDFYMLDSTTLRERYKTAKESGASEAELDALQDEIIETEYRNNPKQRQRMRTLSDLEPYRHLSVEEVVNLQGKGAITAEDMMLKLNFTSLIKRFERENTDILEFASELPYSQKIDIINQKLRDYARID